MIRGAVRRDKLAVLSFADKKKTNQTLWCRYHSWRRLNGGLDRFLLLLKDNHKNYSSNRVLFHALEQPTENYYCISSVDHYGCFIDEIQLRRSYWYSKLGEHGTMILAHLSCILRTVDKVVATPQ